jgi:hypothetical protein
MSRKTKIVQQATSSTGRIMETIKRQMNPSTDKMVALAHHRVVELLEAQHQGAALTANQVKHERAMLVWCKEGRQRVDQMLAHQRLLGDARQLVGSELPGIQPVGPMPPRRVKAAKKTKKGRVA